MADYTVTFGKRGGLTAQFEPEKTLTLKNQPVDKTNLQDLNDISLPFGERLQNGDILVYDKDSNTFVYSSGNVIRDANNNFVFIGDALLPPPGRNVNLGSATRPFKSLFVQGNTISIGNLSLSDSGTGTLRVGEFDPFTGNVVFTGDLSVVSTANLMVLGTDVGNVEFNLSDGAVTTFNAQTTVTTAVDELNEAMLNVFNNTFVRNVQFSANPETGGLGTTVTLTINTEGNPNQYDINWGDGTVIVGGSNSTPSHTYTDNANTPFTITVTARNTNGSGAGSNTTLTRVDYVQIFARDVEPTFEIYSVLTGGTTITEANTGQTIYIDNNTRQVPNTEVTAEYNIDWGDGNSQAITGKTEAGGDQGDRLSHVYTTDSGAGLFTLTLSINAYSSAAPGLLPLSNTQVLKVFDTGIAPPDNITSKTVTWGTSSQGSSPALASGFVANTFANTLSAGQAISSSFPRYTGATVSTAAMPSYFHSNGSVTALFNDTPDILTPTINESGVDYYNLNAQGASVIPVDRIFPPNLYETGIKSTISLDITAFDYGVNKIEFVTDEGNSNELLYVYDNLSVNPTIDVSSATITEKTVSYNYISGIPYYDSNDVLTVGGISVQNLTGQTYYNQSNPFRITASNFGGTIGTGVAEQAYAYTVALNASDRVGGIPLANLASVNVEDLDVNISTGDRIVRLNFNATNVNGTSALTVSDTRIQIYNGIDVINETAIPVADNLGINYTNDGVRVSGFTGATPAFSPSTDYFVNNAWSEPVTVQGTDEAIIRYGSLRHFVDDLSTDFLPVGPDLQTGRSGTQFFRIAFKRAAVSNIRVRLTGKISGFYVALPGTAIDSASTLNGWLDASIQYAGSGVPGADTGNGGNGSNGCAFTGADRILDGVTYSNQTFDLTFGTESTTNSFQNQVLISIALNNDDTLTSISFEDAS